MSPTRPWQQSIMILSLVDRRREYTAFHACSPVTSYRHDSANAAAAAATGFGDISGLMWQTGNYTSFRGLWCWMLNSVEETFKRSRTVMQATITSLSRHHSTLFSNSLMLLLNSVLNSAEWWRESDVMVACMTVRERLNVSSALFNTRIIHSRQCWNLYSLHGNRYLDCVIYRNRFSLTNACWIACLC